MTTRRSIPEDTAITGEDEITSGEWEAVDSSLSEFRAKLQASPRATAHYEKVLGEITARQMTLRKLRTARQMTQSTVGELLEMNQSEVSRLENRSDMLLSTLRRFVSATGGEMHVVVKYPDGAPVELFVGE